MSWKLIVPPTALAVSMAEARAAARVDVEEDGTSALDGDILRAIRTYTAEAEAKTKRAIMQQTWRLTLDTFPAKFVLRRPPLVQVDHIKYHDADGVQRTLDPQDYQVDGERVPGEIVLAQGRAWPATARRINAVEVQITCGYGTDPGAVPDDFSGFILARLSEHFQRGGQAKSEHVARMLWEKVVYGC